MFVILLFAAVSITCISPIEMIRTKMQAKKQFTYKGTTEIPCYTSFIMLFDNWCLFYEVQMGVL